jgi:magnesium transporter
VVDAEGRMKGIVTVDDIVDVVQEEATEDIHKIGGSEALDAPYLESASPRWCASAAVWLRSSSSAARCSRPPRWHYEGKIERAGARAVHPADHLQRRQLRLAGVDARDPRDGAGRGALRDWWRILRRELATGLMIGGLLGTLGMGIVLLRPGHGPEAGWSITLE